MSVRADRRSGASSPQISNASESVVARPGAIPPSEMSHLLSFRRRHHRLRLRLLDKQGYMSQNAQRTIQNGMNQSCSKLKDASEDSSPASPSSTLTVGEVLLVNRVEASEKFVT